MATVATARILPIEQKRIKQDVNRVLLEASNRVQAVLLRYAPDGGAIETRYQTAAIREAGEIVQRAFVGSDGRSAFAEDGVTAQAPLPDLLNRAYVRIVARHVRAAQAFMTKTVPADVLAWLQNARVTEQQRVDDVMSAAYREAALRGYDPMHTWVDPNGYRLSDRIWRASMATRMKVDALLAEGIRNGTSALRLAAQLERFLLPTRAALRTRKPYGTDASFDAMRLARTEITRAAGQATLLMGRLNPYVTGYKWNLSPSHPRIDICDGYAAREWSVDDAIPYPAHPFCICYLTQRVADRAAVTAALREQMSAGEPAPLTPANGNGLLLYLLGAALYRLATQEEGAAA